jgi:hypothetical protein
MTPVDDCRGQLLLIAMQIEALRRWVITRELPPAGDHLFQRGDAAIGPPRIPFRHDRRRPATYHPLPPGQRSIFY